jgi:hypothetical protein
LDLGWGSGHALQKGESLVHLESLADVLGACGVDAVAPKPVRIKQGAIMDVRAPLLTTKQAHLAWGGRDAGAHSREVRVVLILRASAMCLAPSLMSFSLRLRVRQGEA